MQHIKYKNRDRRRWFDVWLNLLKKLENSETSAVDFVEDFKMNLYSKEIYVLPKRRHQIFAKGCDFSGFCI
jgi:GTP pyrophosphokinase